MKSFNFIKLSVTVFLSVLLLSQMLLASDHIDGAATIENGQADLTDLYSFKSSEGENKLSVILNMYPGVNEDGHFSNKVAYRITIRRIEQNMPPHQTSFKTFVSNELSLDCKFLDPSHHGESGSSPKGSVHCLLTNEGELIDEVAGNVGESLKADSFDLFTGPRSDAFFISASAFSKVTSRKDYVTTDAGSQKNSMNTINVMSIVLDLDLEHLGLSDSLIAITGQSYTLRGGLFEALDRVGRPEVTNLGLHNFDSDPFKREFNKTEVFQPYNTLNVKFENRLQQNIQAYDLLNDVEDWSFNDLSALTKILIDDYLIVNTSLNCSDSEMLFLSLEQNLLRGESLSSCGGRALEDDIMVALYTLYIGGLNENRYGVYETGVSAPYQNNSLKALSGRFPYLASPSQTSLKQRFLFEAAKKFQE